MRILLDTHLFLWLASEPEKVPPALNTCLAESENELLLSVVSVWEIEIKRQIGKLRLDIPMADLVARHQEAGLTILPVHLTHVLKVQELPPVHRDPFDRLLIAQAVSEQLVIATADKMFEQYPVEILR